MLAAFLKTTSLSITRQEPGRVPCQLTIAGVQWATLEIRSFFMLEDDMGAVHGAHGGGGAAPVGGGGAKAAGAGGGGGDGSITAAAYALLSDAEKAQYIEDPLNPGHYILNPDHI
jgi:hypothetical protein